jgi:hypothetical protein
MPELPARIQRLIERDFPDSTDAALVTEIVAEAAGSERVQAAVLIAGAADLSEVGAQAELARLDWRDVLMNAGLAGVDWADAIDRELAKRPDVPR